MKPNDAIAQAYEKLHYSRNAYLETHPNRAVTVGHLLGLNLARPSRMRILELGCASGGNLAPLAEQLPHAECIGVDISEDQVRHGCSLIERAGLDNIRLVATDLSAIDHTWGLFDYIIAHGIYSWVPAEVQEHILRIVRENLSTRGIAHISYNVYPGWGTRQVLREAMIHESASLEDPLKRVEASLDILRFLASAIPTDRGVGKIYEEELETLGEAPPEYIFHEFHADQNEPLWFHQFLERLREAKLCYVGDATVEFMFVNRLQPAVEKAVMTRAGGDLAKLEHLMDLVLHRAFRRSLITRGEGMTPRRFSLKRLADLHICAPISFEEEIDPTDASEITFKTYRDKEVVCALPCLKRAWQLVGAAWPESIPFVELYATLLDEFGEVASTGRPTFLVLAENLIFALIHGFIDALPEPRRFLRTIPARPVSMRWARVLSQEQEMVPNLRHQMVRLSRPQRTLIRLLDGTRDVEQLVAEMVRAALAGDIEVTRDGEMLTGEDELREIFSLAVPNGLADLHRTGLLLPH